MVLRLRLRRPHWALAGRASVNCVSGLGTGAMESCRPHSRLIGPASAPLSKPLPLYLTFLNFPLSPKQETDLRFRLLNLYTYGLQNVWRLMVGSDLVALPLRVLCCH